MNFPIEAIFGIIKILEYGQSKGYEPGSWRNELINHHVNKAKGHINDFIYHVDRGEDHLLCALTRLAMAVGVRDQNKYNKEI